MLVFWFLSWPLKVHTTWRVLYILIFTMFLRLYNLSHIFYFKCSPDLKPHPINFLQNVVHSLSLSSLCLFSLCTKCRRLLCRLFGTFCYLVQFWLSFSFFSVSVSVIVCVYVCVWVCMCVFCFSFGRWWLWWCCCPLPIDQCYCPLPLPIASWASTGERGRWGVGDGRRRRQLDPFWLCLCPLFFMLMGSILRFHFEALRGVERGEKGLVGGERGIEGLLLSITRHRFLCMHVCIIVSRLQHTHALTLTHTSKQKHAVACTYMHKHALAAAFFRFVSLSFWKRNENRARTFCRVLKITFGPFCSWSFVLHCGTQWLDCRWG